jgi:hypothetical protein
VNAQRQPLSLQRVEGHLSSSQSWLLQNTPVQLGQDVPPDSAKLTTLRGEVKFLTQPFRLSALPGQRTFSIWRTDPPADLRINVCSKHSFY